MRNFTEEELVIDEESSFEEIFEVLQLSLETILDTTERMKAGSEAVAIMELALQSIDLLMLLREKTGDVSIELDFDLDESEVDSTEAILPRRTIRGH